MGITFYICCGDDNTNTEINRTTTTFSSTPATCSQVTPGRSMTAAAMLVVTTANARAR